MSLLENHLSRNNKINKSSYKPTKFIIMFLLPSIILFLLIYAYPLLTIFITSFCKWDYNNLAKIEFLGFSNLFDNYKFLFFEDIHFKTAIINSLKWVATGLFIHLSLAVVMALILSQKIKGWTIIRNIFVIPNIISAAAMCMVFLKLYDPDIGIINIIIHFFNKSYPLDSNFLLSPKGAFWGVTFAYVFYSGTSCLILLSRISAIPKDIYEAAIIDGASNLKQLWYITLPIIRSTIGTIGIIIANSSFLIYNEVKLIVDGGVNGSAYSLSYMINTLSTGMDPNMARANTVGVIQFLIGIIIVFGLSFIFKTNKAVGD